MEIFKLLTPISYWILIIAWSLIFIFYIQRLTSKDYRGTFFFTLVLILTIDAFRTLFESVYFGVWYSSLLGLIPNNLHGFLIRPENVFIPKFVNVLAAFLILIILVRRWLPQEEEERIKQIAYTRDLEMQIAERKRIEQELRASEEKYRNLSDATFEGVLFSDNRRIVSANEILTDMFGYDAEEVIGMDLIDFVAEESKDTVLKNIESNHDQCYEIKCVRKDGSIFPVQCCGRIVMREGREFRQSGIRDISDLKKSEDERVRHEKLQGVIEMAGAICHELNQPMMAALGYSEIVARQLPEDEKLKERMLLIKENIEEMGLITKKLMKITRYKTKHYIEGQQIIDIEKSSDLPDKSGN